MVDGEEQRRREGPPWLAPQLGVAKRVRHGDHKSLSAQQMDCLGDSVRDAFTRHDMAAGHASSAVLRQHYAKH